MSDKDFEDVGDVDQALDQATKDAKKSNRRPRDIVYPQSAGMHDPLLPMNPVKPRPPKLNAAGETEIEARRRGVLMSGYPAMPNPQEVTDLDSMQDGDPLLYDALITIRQSLRNRMVPKETQHLLFEWMDTTVRREIVQKAAGLEASVVVTFKEQLALIDQVTQRVITRDGRADPDGAALDISVKDALNMSLKVTGMITRDLPKVISLERVQRKEQVLLQVVEQMDEKSRLRFLTLLEEAETEALKNAQS